MGAVVKAISLSKPILNLFRKGALALESKAAKECMKDINFNPNKLDILINAGIYRDDHIIEPAAATLIQREAGANPLFNAKHRTFSFDLDNGPCGVLTGIQLIDGYLQSGIMNYGMIVAGDSDPRPGLQHGYNFDPIGGAILLEPGKDGKGFVKFKTNTYLKHKYDFTSQIEWMAENGGKKTHYLVMRNTKCYLRKCIRLSSRSFEDFTKEAGIKPEKVDLVITSQSPEGLIEGFAKKTGLGKKVVDVTKTFGNLHTAGPMAALKQAMDDGRFGRARNVVFLTVGAGITVSMALYKK